MRNLRQLDRYRDMRPSTIAYLKETGVEERHWDKHGVFYLPIQSHEVGTLKVLASVAAGWDHISVSLPDRCPTWAEMEHVASVFFKPNEIAMQLHVPATDHVNFHPFCLHWWRPLGKPILRPSKVLVGSPA
jgi:hypothetical protein